MITIEYQDGVRNRYCWRWMAFSEHQNLASIFLLEKIRDIGGPQASFIQIFSLLNAVDS